MVIGENRMKLYKYRDLAIQALNESIARRETRSSDLTITSILIFMAMEVLSRLRRQKSYKHADC